MASTLSRSWLPALSLLACGTVAQAAPPSDWKAKDGYYFRLESDGNVGCYSPDGVNCTWGKPVEPARTLTCGARHKAIWGDTGYVHQDHWCNVVYATFFAKWTDYRILGHDFMLSKNPEGDTMCLSKDGRLCASTSEAPRQNDWKEVRPVVCGPSSQAKGVAPGTRTRRTGAGPAKSLHAA
ncbi:hypothetical protein ACQ859_02725 [Roseateles chitinivorans]|uniref:hypothetical protein n=1 Tax=Roseateles chitinivorans TaxID=2917965 RepID=UPI003D67E8C4